VDLVNAQLLQETAHEVRLDPRRFDEHHGQVSQPALRRERWGGCKNGLKRSGKGLSERSGSVRDRDIQRP
jgi:hypothetical protein